MSCLNEALKFYDDTKDVINALNHENAHRKALTAVHLKFGEDMMWMVKGYTEREMEA